MKRLLVFFFCLLFLLSGPIWAWADCFRHSHEGIGEHHQSQTAAEFDHHQDPSDPIIHCTPISEEVGPAAPVAPAGIRRSDSGVSLHAVSPAGGRSFVFENDLWLEALFKKIVTFSLPNDISRHLFLSVLQI